MAVPSSTNADIAAAHSAPGGHEAGREVVVDGGGLNDVGSSGVQGVEENIISFVENMEAGEGDTIDGVATDGIVERSADAPASAVEPGAVAAPAVARAPQAVEPAPAVAKAPVVAPVAPVAPVAAAPQQGQVPVQGQDPAAAQPVQPAAVAPQQGEAAPVDPFALAARTIQEHEGVFVQTLADQVYKIDQEQFDKVLGGDSATLSLLCARVHANAVSSCMRTVAQTLPVYVEGLLRVRQTSNDREQRFWEANPHLSKTEHKAYLGPIVQAAKALNPQADEKTLFATVGRMAAAQFQIAMQAAPVANAQPTVRTPGPVVRQTSPAFAPAGTNGAAPGPNGHPGQFNANPFSRMTDIMQADDQGLFD